MNLWINDFHRLPFSTHRNRIAKSRYPRPDMEAQDRIQRPPYGQGAFFANQ